VASVVRALGRIRERSHDEADVIVRRVVHGDDHRSVIGEVVVLEVVPLVVHLPRHAGVLQKFGIRRPLVAGWASS